LLNKPHKIVALAIEPYRMHEIYRIGPSSKLDFDVSTGTPLLAAVKYGNLPVVQALVAHGVNINEAFEVGYKH
jgi:ankyrin repeat protein